MEGYYITRQERTNGTTFHIKIDVEGKGKKPNGDNVSVLSKAGFDDS